MICENCQTTLPDEALACWKCGKPTGQPTTVAQPTSPPHKKTRIDPLVAVFTLLISAVFFACFGWAVPFTVWGRITNIGADYPQWAQVFGVVSGIAGVASALITFIGVWWLSAWLITRIIRPG